MTRTQQFIEEYKKVLTSGADFYNPDTTLMSVEEFDKAKCKILLILPTPHVVKTVSSTVAAINDYIITHCPNTFLDVAYMPENEDIKRYDEWNVPYAIGNITHLDPSHFDIIGFSISVLNEVVTAPVMLKTFDRCDKPIPLFWSQRKDCKLGEYPIIYGGGITAVCGESMFGKVNVHGKEEQAYLDFLYLGDCGQTDKITNRFIEAIETSVASRAQSDHDVPGYPHSDIPNFEEKVKVTTIQEFAECLFDLQEIYQPQAYDVEYNEHNQIIKNIKINPKARDFVTPYYPHIMEPDLGIGRTVIQANGDNCGTTQTQVSEGCSAGGACSFCSEGNYCLPKGTLVKSTEGLVAIDKLKVGDKVVLLDKQLSVLDTVVVGQKPTIIFELSNHQKIKVANTHLILTIENGHLLYKRAFNLKDGDFIAYERSKSFGSNKTDKAYLVGAIIGDGLFYPEHNLVKVYSPNHEVEEMKFNLSWMSCSRHSASVMKFSKQTKELTHELLDLGLSHEIASTKRIPKFFFNADKETVVDLLRGMFDTDGSIRLDSKKRATISYTTVSEKLKDDLVAILSMFGIRATVYQDNHKAHYKSTGEWIKDSHSWSVEIFGNENIRRFKEIGFGLLSKQEKLEESVEAAYEVDYIPTFEKRVSDWYHQDKDFNRQVRLYNDSLRKVVNGWTNMHWLSKRHFQKSFEFLSEDIRKDYILASQFEFVQIISVEEGPEEMMFDINVEGDHAYSLCGWVSHNTGGWVEKDEPQIINELWEAKKYSAGYKYKPYSFNANYVRDYKGKLAKFIQIYPKVTFINMRMEELGRDTDALRMMKLVGSNRISAPMEGMSPRIQNNLLNKCLSEESLNNFMDDMVHAKMTDIKCVTKDALTPVQGKGLLTQEDVLNIAPVRYGVYAEKTLICNFSRGISIEGTPDHKVLVKSSLHELSFKEISKLKKGDKVYIKIGTNCYGGLKSVKIKNYVNCYTSIRDDREFDITLTPDIALMLGWCTGDGTVETTLTGARDRVRFYFASDELDVASKITQTLKNLGYYSSEGWVKDSVYCVRSFNKNFAVFMEKMIGHHYDGKFIHSLILQSPKEVQIAFIRGLMGADGTICNIKKGNNEHSTICITLHNKQIIRTLQQMLFNMGIVSHIRDGVTKCAGKSFVTYSLNILQQHHRLYMSEVGFEGRKDKFQLCELPQKGLRDSIKEVNGFIPIELISSEESEAEVYKFQTDSHVYITNGIVSHNCGGIFTGYEEDEDFQWMCDFVDHFKKRAAKEGGNFPFRLKCTPLVHYPLTPIEYLERKSAKKSYYGEHWLTDEWYEKFREHQVFFKVNGFRYSTFLEQTFVDLGRSLTPLVYKHFVSQEAPIYSLRSCATDEYLADLRKLVDKDVYFNDRDPEHYISPCHRIHIELMGSYVPRARRLLRHKHEGNIFNNQPDIRCLKTFEGAKVHCYHSCIVKDPLKIYSDVTMDSEGNLHGDYSDLTGCRRCPTNERRRERLAREIVQTKNSDDIIATPRLPQVQKIRFVLKRASEYDVLNPLNVMHTVMSKFLQTSDELLHSYHSIINSNMFWQSAPGFKDFQAGFMIMDTMWSKNSIKLVKEVIPEVNKQLKTAQVISADSVLRDEKISITDYNIYIFESTLPRELFAEASLHYKGQIFVEAQVQGFALTEIQDKGLKAPLFIQKAGKTIGSFAIPCKYNPVMYMKGFLSQAKKTSEDGVVTTTTFDCKLTVRETRAVARQFNEHATISVATGKPLPFGLTGLCNILLSKL